MRCDISTAFGLGILGTNFGLKVITPAVLKNKKFRLIGVANSASVTRSNYPLPYDVPMLQKTDLISNPNIKIVWIATPPETQFALVEEVLKAGKIAVCEKPCGVSTEDVDQLRSVSEELHLPVFIDFEFRYDPIYTNIFLAAEQIKPNQFFEFRVIWKTYSNAERSTLINHKSKFLDFVIHVFDCFLEFAKSIGAIFLDSREQIGSCSVCGTHLKNCTRVKLRFDCFAADVSVCRNYVGIGKHEIELKSENIKVISGIFQPFTSNDLFYTENAHRQSSSYGVMKYSLKEYFHDLRIYSVGLLLDDIGNHMILGKASKRLPDISSALRVHKVIDQMISSGSK